MHGTPFPGRQPTTCRRRAHRALSLAPDAMSQRPRRDPATIHSERPVVGCRVADTLRLGTRRGDLAAPTLGRRGMSTPSGPWPRCSCQEPACRLPRRSARATRATHGVRVRVRARGGLPSSPPGDRAACWPCGAWSSSCRWAWSGTLLGSGLTSDSSLTNHPESDAAQELIDARLPKQNPIDEVIVVRSERLVVSDPAYAARVRALVARDPSQRRREQVSSYLDPGATSWCPPTGTPRVLPVVVAEPQDERIADLIAARRARGRERRVRGAHHRQPHARSRLHGAVGERPEQRRVAVRAARPR